MNKLLAGKGREEDFIAQTRKLIGPEQMSKDDAFACFRVNVKGDDKKRLTLHLAPPLDLQMYGKPVSSTASNLMRMWLVDYIVDKSKERAKAFRCVKWFGGMVNNSVMVGLRSLSATGVIDMLFVPMASATREHPEYEIARLNDDNKGLPLSF